MTTRTQQTTSKNIRQNNTKAAKQSNEHMSKQFDMIENFYKNKSPEDIWGDDDCGW